MLLRKTADGAACTGDGIAARCTTASAPGMRSPPATASSAWPASVRSAYRNGAGDAGELDSADGTRSTLRTSWPASSSARMTARPALPLPPVTTTFIGSSPGPYSLGGGDPGGRRPCRLANDELAADQELACGRAPVGQALDEHLRGEASGLERRPLDPGERGRGHLGE